jgi:hypothetical protein
MEERGVPCARRSWKKKRQRVGLVDLLKGCRDPPACFFYCMNTAMPCPYAQIAGIKYHTTVKARDYG